MALGKSPSDIRTDDPTLLIDDIGDQISDEKLKRFSVKCYRTIDESYLSEEAKTVIQIIEAQLAGNEPLVSPPEALSALSLEILDSALNSDSLMSVISSCVSDLLEKPALASAKSAIRAKGRVAQSKELFLKGLKEKEKKTDFTKEEDAKQTANLLREISGIELEPS